MTDDPTNKPKDKTMFGLPGSPPTGGSGDMRQSSAKKEDGQPPQDSPFVVNPQRRSSYPPPKFSGPSPSLGAKPVPAPAAKPPGAVPPGGAKKPPAKTILGMPVMSPMGKPGQHGAPPPAAPVPAPVPAPMAAPAQPAKAAAPAAASPLGKPTAPKPVTDGTFRTTPKSAPITESHDQPQVQPKSEKEGFAPTMMAYMPGTISQQQQQQQPVQPPPPGPAPQYPQAPPQPQPQPAQPQPQIGEFMPPEAAPAPQPEKPAYPVIGPGSGSPFGQGPQAQPPGGAPPGGGWGPPPGGPGSPGAPPPGAPGGYGPPPQQPGAPGGYGPPAQQPGAPGGPPMAGPPPGAAPPPKKKGRNPLIYVGIGCGALILIGILITIIMVACSYCAARSTKAAGQSLIESQLEEIEKQCDKQVEAIKADPNIPEDQKEQQIKLIEEGCEQSIEEAKKALGL